MSKIKIERNPNKEQLDALGVTGWPIWTKEASQFPWSYDASETCYFLEGDVIVTPDGGEPVAMDCWSHWPRLAQPMIRSIAGNGLAVCAMSTIGRRLESTRSIICTKRVKFPHIFMLSSSGFSIAVDFREKSLYSSYAHDY